MGRARGAVRVPNVKLRPANPNTAQSKKNVITSDDEEVEDPRLLQVGRSIFKGVTVCATGIKNKREVFDKVKRMGGTHSTDFTDLTTHLIAEETGSQKYTCAIERDVPVVMTSWIEEAWEKWIHGDVFDVDATVDAHRLLPFRGMKICITGIETADVRARIHKLAKKFGGEYLKNLDKTCTHLLCSVAASEKIDWANKANAEREILRSRYEGKPIPPPIHLLWEEWFWDCVFKQGLLPYDIYHIVRPRPEPMSLSVMNSPEVFVKPLPVTLPRGLPPPLPLANLLAAAGDSALPVKRKKDAAGEQWDSIIKRHSVGVTGSSMQASSLESNRMHLDGENYTSKSTSPMKKSWAKNNNATPTAPGWSRRSPVKKSVAASSKSNVTGTQKKISVIKLPSDSTEIPSKHHSFPSVQGSFLGKFKRTAAFDETEKAQESESATPTDNTARRIFAGLSFILLGEAACDAVSGALVQAGGTVLVHGTPDYFIVRLVGGAKHMLEQPTKDHSKFRTECWLERCLFEKRPCPADENITYVPLVVSPTPEASSKFLVAFSGLDSFERTWVSRLLRGLGIKISLDFSSHCTHLLCPSQEGVKCVKAREWNIPIVGFDWLVELAKVAAVEASSESITPIKLAGDADDGNLRVEKSMEAMHLEKDGNSKPLPQEGALFSPVFKITSRNQVVAHGRPPSPASPSPQRRKVLPNGTGNVATPSKVLAPGALKPIHHSPLHSNASNTEATKNVAEISFNSSSATKKTNSKSATKSPFRPPVTQRIPSSATPSPLATRFTCVSPSKPREEMASTSGFSMPFSLQPASAQALSRNLGAILGSKRVAEDDLDGGTSSATSGAEAPRKRPRRPQPNRPKHIEGISPRKLGSVPPINIYDNDEDHGTMSIEPPSEPLGGIAVNYSDPSEVEERKRLLMLINKPEPLPAEPEIDGKRARVGPRKSARHRGNHV